MAPDSPSEGRALPDHVSGAGRTHADLHQRTRYALEAAATFRTIAGRGPYPLHVDDARDLARLLQDFDLAQLRRAVRHFLNWRDSTRYLDPADPADAPLIPSQHIDRRLPFDWSRYERGRGGQLRRPRSNA